MHDSDAALTVSPALWGAKGENRFFVKESQAANVLQL